MAAKTGKRWQKQMQARIEKERETAVSQLRDLGLSPEVNGVSAQWTADHPRDEGDQAQASERADLGFMTRERLAERINRLTVALERIGEGTYGVCEMCGAQIETPRLEALPDATRCLACQERSERERAA
ncbi:MAG: TraR/DksA C4-type zinc finger protein [Candidatus Rokubacteria bacterium]|nr:TraR/DksA C4-type zinc finger protein [Candidatus Rokubacteria bacterium]